MLELFLDSADPKAIETWMATGLPVGVTSNPSILQRAGLGSSDIPDFVSHAVDHGAREVFCQVWGESVDDLVRRGEQFRSLSPAVRIKVPLTADGAVAARRLSEGGPVVLTACFSPTQVSAAIVARATWISPFVAKMNESRRDAMQTIAKIQAAIANTGSELEIFAGSIRTPEQVVDLAAAGVSRMAIGAAVWEALVTDSLTEAMAEQFHEIATSSPEPVIP